MLHWHFVPNHLIENSLLVGFLYTNVSFTYLNLFHSIYFTCSGAWSARGNVFINIEEFSCENRTCTASSFSTPSFFVVNHSFSSKREAVSRLYPTNKQPRGKKCSFCIGTLLLSLCEGSLICCALGSAYSWCI